jgi:dihydrofolate reductase
MRKLILKMSMSADGFVGGADGRIDWLFKSVDDGATAWTIDSVWNASLHIMGSKTFHDMAAWWPTSDEIYAAPMNAIPKAVFTRRGAESLRQSLTTRAIHDAGQARDQAGGKAKPANPEVLRGWREAYVTSGPIEDEIAKLKQQDGKPMLAHGGAGFARSLIKAGVVDEFRLLVHPVVLGKGLPIFSELEAPLRLELVSVSSFPAGTVAEVYRPSR